jgi:hypothetical protein
MRQHITKVNLVKTITKIYSQGFYRNLFHIFHSLIAFFTYFRILYKFLISLKENEKNEKPHHSGGSAFGRQPSRTSSAQRPNRPTGPCRWLSGRAVTALRAGVAARLPAAIQAARCDSAEWVSMRESRRVRQT